MKYIILNNKIKYVLKIYSFLLIFFFYSHPIFSQITGSSAAIQLTGQSSFYVCQGSAPNTLRITNNGTNSMTNVKFSLDLPTGSSYETGSVSSNPVGTTEYSVTNLNVPVFTLPNLPASGYIDLTYNQSFDCSVIAFQGSGGLTKDIGTLLYTLNGTNYTQNLDPLTTYNVRSASLSIISATNNAFSGNLGGSFSQTVTIRNGGLGYISDLEVNLGVLGGVSVSNPTLGTLSGNKIIFNTANMPGGNGKLDTDEDLVFSYTVTINSCNNLSRNLVARFGCSSQTCQSSSNYPVGVSILNNTPNLGVVANWANGKTDCFEAEEPVTMTITNNGSGPANNISVWISSATANLNSGNDYISWLQTSDFEYSTNGGSSWTAITSSGTVLHSRTGAGSCVPVGAISGFNAALPGVFLSAGANVLVRGKLRNCRITDANACSPSYTRYGQLAYRLNYSNQCGITVSTGSTPLAAINSPNKGASSSAYIFNEVPGSVAANTYATLQFKLKNDGNTLNTTNNYGEVEWTIPSGLSFIGNTGDLTVLNPSTGVTMPILSGYPQLVGNKLTIRYNASTSTTVDVVLRLLNNCSGGVGNMNVSIPMIIRTVRNTSCSTAYTYGAMACQTLNTYLLCPGNNCSTGGFSMDMGSKIQRGTFGQPDNNGDGLPDANGSLNMNAIQIHRYAEADLIDFNLKVNVSTGSVTSFAYTGMDLVLNSNDFLTTGNATVTIYDVSTNNEYTCFSPATLGSNSLGLNFSSCSGLPNGFTYNNGDSLRVQFQLKVKEKNGTNSQLVYPANPSMAVTAWGANVASPSAGQKYSCGPFFYNYNIYSQGYNVTADGSSTSMSGCGEYRHGIRLYTSEYTGNQGNAFPNEYRLANRLDSVVFTLSPNVLFANKITLSIQKAVGTDVIDYVLPASVYSVNGDVISVNLKSIWGSSSVLTPSTGAPIYSIYAYVTPKCSLPTSFSGLTAPVNTDIWYNRYRVTSVASPLVVNNNDITTSGSFTQPVTLSTAQSSVITTSSTAQWDFTLSNSTISPAQNTYLYFKKSSPFTNVTLTDLSSNTVLTPNINGIYTIGTLAASTNKNYRIIGNINTCSQDSVKIAAGWSCNAYPTNVNEAICENTLTLKAQGETSSMDALFDFIPNATGSKVSLCSEVYIEATINSTLIGGLKQVNYSIALPEGLTYVNNSVLYAFPASSSYGNSSYNPIQTGKKLYFNVNQIAAALNNGLSGVGNLSTKSLKIKFKVATVCGFVSGVSINANFNATSPCGNVIPEFNKTSLPMNLAGASPSSSFVVNVNTPSTFSACGAPKYITVTARNSGITNSIASDSLYVTLPNSLQYGAGSAVSTGGIDPIEIQPLVNGNILKWGIPVGTPPNGIVSVAFKLIADLPGCSSSNVILAETRQNIALSCGASSCSSPIITASKIQSVNVSKSNLTFSNATMSILPKVGNKEQVSLSFQVKNIGGDTLRGTARVNVINDSNKNGSYQSGEPVLSQIGIPFGMLPNATKTITHTFDMNSSICSILLKMDSTLNICNCPLSEIPVTLNNYNAMGISSTLNTCPNGPLTLGSAPISGYSYSWSSVGAAPIGYLSATNIPQPSFIATNAGTFGYQVLINKGSGCIVKDTVTITVGTIPTPNFVGLGTSYCENSSPVSLVANPFGGIFTINGSPATSFNPKTLGIGNHVVTYNFNNGCTATATRNVQINAATTTLPSFNTQGVPSSATIESISQTLIDNINATLPETYPVPLYSPQFVAKGLDFDTNIEQGTNLSITFVKEGAGFKNTLAYYTYTGTPPVTPPCDITVVFPNTSETNSGGGLTTGSTVDLGFFPTGTKIGWVLLADAYDGTTIGAGKWDLYSNPSYNTMLPTGVQQQSVMFYDPQNDVTVLGFEDLKRDLQSSDSDFNDAVFYLKTSTTAALRTAGLEPSIQSGSSSSGVYGGLESQLANKIASRMFVLNMNGSTKIDNREIQMDFNINDAERENELPKFIPQNFLPNTISKISTPQDLPSITNAKEVLSVDYYDYKDRVATILAIQTNDKVYEHTKIICDRLAGAKLAEIREIKIEGKIFAINKLIQASGNIEYALSFSAYEENNQLYIDNQWSVDQFPKKAKFYNFQIWSKAPYISQRMAIEVIKKLRVYQTVSMASASAKIPKVYVRSGHYQNGLLYLDIYNPIKASEVTVSGRLSRTETAKSEESWSFKIPLNGKTEQSISLKLGKVFDTGILIENNKAKEADYMYLADGVWGTGINPDEATVSSFEVTLDPIKKELDPSEYLVERNAVLKGKVKKYAVLFRNLLPSGRTMDLRAFRQLSFEGSGKGTFEVVLVKKSISDWNRQFRTTLQLEDYQKLITIPMSAFKSIASTSFVPDDIVSVVIAAKGDNITLAPFEMSIAELKFGKFQDGSNNKVEVLAYPNPTQDRCTLESRLSENSEITINIFNISGILVQSFKRDGHKGFNRWELDLQDFNNGLYNISLSAKNEQFRTKIVFHKE
jgi:Domain of unknown function (DUF4114)/Secretion system C-terminal sorting domain